MNVIDEDLESRWIELGHDEKILRSHPDFVRFMSDSKLLSQMKVTRDAIQLIDGEPSIKVEGRWTGWKVIKKHFHFDRSPQFQELFIVHNKSGEVYTYLDRGQGLEKHHPYLSNGLAVISSLDEKEYEQLLSVAKRFPRQGDEERPFILQIVSSYMEGAHSRFHELLIKPKHPYLRVVMGEDDPVLKVRKGEVYEVGFRFKNKPSLPFEMTEGHFRSPDHYEYIPCHERVVTNIPISLAEMRNLFGYVQKIHQEHVDGHQPIAFHFGRQNCAAFVRYAVQQVGVDLPAEISLPQLVTRVLPYWICATTKGMGKFFLRIKPIIPSKLEDGIRSALEKIGKLVFPIIKAVTALFLASLHLIAGSAMGAKGRSFACNGGSEISPLSWGLGRWFDLHSYNVHLPGVVQEWQRKQLSTQIFKAPRRLAILQKEDVQELDFATF